jgi:hypothetical protein
MIHNELKTPFPFYDNISKQYRFREECESTCKYKLITPNNTVLPFQFKKNHTIVDSILSFEVMNLDDSRAYAFSNNINLLSLINLGGFDYITFKGEALNFAYNNGQVGSVDMCKGFYYIKITTMTGSYFSEVFYVDGNNWNDPDFVNPYMILEWKDTSDVANIYYQDGYVNRLYIDEKLEKNESEIEEEGLENDFGDFIPTFQKFIKNYRFMDFIPEYIIDSLIVAGMHNYIHLTLKKNLYSGEIKRLNVLPKWQGRNCFASCEVKFQQQENIYKDGCSNNLF